MNSAHQRQHADAACCGSGCATVPVAPEPTASDATTIGPQRFRIENMDCASEESEIRRALEGMAGIRSLRFNLGDRELAIAADDHALPEALEAIRKAGFKPEPLGAKNVQRFRIANMDCASEESEIRRALDGMAGIRSLQFNLG
ncbi:heavy metal translocating P-type ATPase, partial [Acidovorax sp. HMWF018]